MEQIVIENHHQPIIDHRITRSFQWNISNPGGAAYDAFPLRKEFLRGNCDELKADLM